MRIVPWLKTFESIILTQNLLLSYNYIPKFLLLNLLNLFFLYIFLYFFCYIHTLFSYGMPHQLLFRLAKCVIFNFLVIVKLYIHFCHICVILLLLSEINCVNIILMLMLISFKITLLSKVYRDDWLKLTFNCFFGVQSGNY